MVSTGTRDPQTEGFFILKEFFMRTNKEKYNHYKRIVDKNAQEYTDKEFPTIPKEFYSITNMLGDNVETKTITSVGYSFGYGVNLYEMDKPTRKDVEKAKTMSENMPTFFRENIRFAWKIQKENHKSSGSESLKDIDNGIWNFFNLEDAKKECEKRKKKYGKKEGYVPCAYCSKQVKEEAVVVREIIFRTGGGIGRSKNNYCSSQCGFHDQCAHEG